MRRLRPSPAMTVALIALFIALGGTGYAALKLPKNSVGSKQIKKGAVTPSKVSKGTISLFKGQTGDRGPQGVQGIQGIQGLKGDPGPSAAYDQVHDGGTIVFSSTQGGAAVSVPAGHYVVVASTFFGNGTGAATDATCSVSADGSSTVNGGAIRSAIVPAGASVEISNTATVDVSSGSSTIQTNCSVNSATTQNIHAQITAIAVGSLSEQ